MSQFFYGVIEGFYGRPWSWAERRDYAQFMRPRGFDCYIFAPKAEVRLRSEWREPLTTETAAELRNLAACYHEQGLRWGVGLSPMGLGERFDESDKQALSRKIDELNQLQPDILCILFDDMRGDIPGLADRQLEVMAQVLNISTAEQHILCPTYYSFDPVLEEVFGPQPAGYWEQLGAGLAPEVGLFWTGPQVISSQISTNDLLAAGEALGRLPVLWDNYPVNDGRATWSHLHLKPYSERSDQISQLTQGHLVNPMNQAQLSKLVLHTLPNIYRGEGGAATDFSGAYTELLGSEQLAIEIMRDREAFQERGLETFSEGEIQDLLERYKAFNQPAAREIVDWLQGEYRFDPACLTG